MTNKLLMLSLDKAKDIAEVLSNDTARKILNYLADREDATESHLAKELNIPLPTVHYNLKKLMESGLVMVETFHYSKKGREVQHYKLANKHIVISPKPVKGLLRKLRGILPALGTVIGVGVLVEILQNFRNAPLAYTQSATEEKAMLLGGPMEDAAAAVVTEAPSFLASHLGLVLILGGLLAVGVFALWKWREKE